MLGRARAAIKRHAVLIFSFIGLSVLVAALTVGGALLSDAKSSLESTIDSRIDALVAASSESEPDSPPVYDHEVVIELVYPDGKKSVQRFHEKIVGEPPKSGDLNALTHGTVCDAFGGA
jgi:hypothetical protein